MARPKKADNERKTTDLRIPLTEAQKQMIVEVARKAGLDMAAWARPILLLAAEAQLLPQEAERAAKR